jgi:hypothetical protein
MAGQSLQFGVKVHIPGLDAFNPNMTSHLIRAMFSLGNQTKTRVGVKMRKDTGEEIASLQLSVGGFDPTNYHPFFSVFSTKIQAFIDEKGARPHFPPWKRGTKLYKWAERRGMFQPRLLASQARALGQLLGKGGVKGLEQSRVRQNESTVFLIARKQSLRGLPRPGDPLRMPFEKTAEEIKGLVELTINAEIAAVCREANQVA